MPMRLLNLNRTLSHAILVAIKSSLWSHEPVQEPTVALHFDRPIAKELPIEFQVEEDLYPIRSEFNIDYFAFLSSEYGDGRLW